MRKHVDRAPEIRENKSEILHYDDPDLQVMCRKNYLPKGIIFPEMTIHWHNDLEFIYVQEGRVGYQLNGHSVVMNEGEGIFVNSRQLHVIMSPEENTILNCIIFHPMLLCSSKLIEKEYVTPITDNDEIPYILLSEKVEWQCELLHRLSRLYETSEVEKNELNIVAGIFEIWKILYDNIEVKDEKHRKYDYNLEIVTKMLKYIHTNFYEKITLDDLCKNGGVGRTNCTKLFDKYVGMTPMEYVRTYRITKSIEFLADTDMSISQIAYEVGFSGSSYFTESFREHVGMNPLEYRKQCKGRNE